MIFLVNWYLSNSALWLFKFTALPAVAGWFAEPSRREGRRVEWRKDDMGMGRGCQRTRGPPRTWRIVARKIIQWKHCQTLKFSIVTIQNQVQKFVSEAKNPEKSQAYYPFKVGRKNISPISRNFPLSWSYCLLIVYQDLICLLCIVCMMTLRLLYVNTINIFLSSMFALQLFLYVILHFDLYAVLGTWGTGYSSWLLNPRGGHTTTSNW